MVAAPAAAPGPRPAGRAPAAGGEAPAAIREDGEPAARTTSPRTASGSPATTPTANRGSPTPPGHPFCLATLFQPEPAGDGSVPHPFVRGLAEAAVEYAANRGSRPMGW